MPGRMPFRRLIFSLSIVLFVASAAFAQFNASIQGVVRIKVGQEFQRPQSNCEHCNRRYDGYHQRPMRATFAS